MIVIGTRAHGQQRRRPIPVLDYTFHKSEWLESGDDPVLSPTSFLVEQPPNSTLVAHFHRQNQFQVFVAGGGRIGPTALGPVTVHYAGAYTGYGPLVAGDEGIRYFTIRPVCESGYVRADDREKMRRGPKRHAVSAQVARSAPEALAALTGPRVDALIPPAPDGLGASVLQIGPEAIGTIDHLPASQGLFVVVIGGSLRHAGQTLGEWEQLFVSADTPPPALQAGPDGLQCLILHTPPLDPAYAADATTAAAS